MLFTLKGKVHDAGVQCVHLCVRITVHDVEVFMLLVGVLGEWTVAEVRDGVEGGCLGRGGGHGGEAGLSVELGLELVVLVHG